MELTDIDLTQMARFGGDMPHDWFTFLRAEAPVWYHPAVDGVPELGGEGFWVVSRYADLVAVNRDWQSYSSETGPGRSSGGVIIKDGERGVGRMLVMMDPPRQTRMRQLVNKAFSPRMIRSLERRTRERCRAIFDAVAPRGRCEFVDDVATELPLQVLAEILGVPEQDRHRVFEWTNRTLDCETSEPERDAAVAEMARYAHTLGEEKRRHPADDVLTGLILAEITEEDGSSHRLSPADIDLFFHLLMAAGSETTRNAIAGGLEALLQHPEELAKLRDDPELLPSAVEEILRWTTPVNYFRRTATRDVELRDQKIRAGEKVTIWHCSANRDEEVFDAPFRFDVARAPNPHVAFGGGGPHYCIGANLARMEMRAVFAELLSRLDAIELDGEVTRFHTRWDVNVFGGYRRLPIRFEARA